MAAPPTPQTQAGCGVTKKRMGKKILKRNDFTWPQTACGDHIAPICFPILWLSDLIFIRIERQVTSCSLEENPLVNLWTFFQNGQWQASCALCRRWKERHAGKDWKGISVHVSCNGLNPVLLFTRTWLLLKNVLLG